jgi:hypothetical protein
LIFERPGVCQCQRLPLYRASSESVRSTSTRRLICVCGLPSALCMSSSPSNDVDTTWMPPVLPAFSSLHWDSVLSVLPPLTTQADLSRLTNVLKTLVEVNRQCWKGEDCDLSKGVKQGIVALPACTQHHTDLLELRVHPQPLFCIVKSFLPDPRLWGVQD